MVTTEVRQIYIQLHNITNDILLLYLLLKLGVTTYIYIYIYSKLEIRSTFLTAGAPLQSSGPNTRVPVVLQRPTMNGRTADLNLNIVGICEMDFANEPDCVLCANYNTGRVMRVSLATQRVEELLNCVNGATCKVTGVQMMPSPPDAPRVAVFFREEYFAGGRGEFRHFVRLVDRQNDGTWRSNPSLLFDTSESTDEKNRVAGACLSYGFLLCAALQSSRLLVSLKVSGDSQLQKIGVRKFDYKIYGVCAFTSGGEQLVATTHNHKSFWNASHFVIVSRSLLNVSASSSHSHSISLQECSRVRASNGVGRIICSNAGLVVSGDKSNPSELQLCRMDGTRIDDPVTMIPLSSNTEIQCWCRVQGEIVAADRNSSNSLLVLRPEIYRFGISIHNTNLSAIT